MEIINIIADFINSTAWPMETPKAYGPFHLTFLVVGLAISILLAYKLRNVGDKGNKIVLIITGSILILSEIYKQLFYYFYIGNWSYQWWIFPFQLCSVPMYLCIIAPLLKKGVIQQGMYDFMVYFNFLGGLAAYVEPSGLVHEYYTLTYHAFFWHMALIFIGLYLILSKRAKLSIKDYLYSAVTFIGLAIVAFCINLAFFDVSQGTINMFFIGPANSSLIVFKDIAKNYGWYVSTLLYIPTVCFGAYIVFVVCSLINKIPKKKSKAY